MWKSGIRAKECATQKNFYKKLGEKREGNIRSENLYEANESHSKNLCQ